MGPAERRPPPAALPHSSVIREAVAEAFTQGDAHRDVLVVTALGNHAPPDVVYLLSSLPRDAYRSIDELLIDALDHA
jgi:hypothetical protein